ncbi:manganese transporter [Streptomyces griseocarneus]|nr:manganese transporter [Streptomyces griseocarneus]
MVFCVSRVQPGSLPWIAPLSPSAPRRRYARAVLVPWAAPVPLQACVGGCLVPNWPLGPSEAPLTEAGDPIHGALGSITTRGARPRQRTVRTVVLALMAILGPGLITMVNDAAAFSTYTQAGQNYGTGLLWTLALLVPVLYVNQEMAVRLGAVTGVGHARLILSRFGKFWCAFCLIDLLLFNALTMMIEFIGVSLAVGYLGLSRPASIAAATIAVVAAGATGSFRRFERMAIALCVGSLLLIPVGLIIHPAVSRVAVGLFVPTLPGGVLPEILLVAISIVGAAVTPWQLFFQQSYVVDKRITPRFLGYGKADLWIGIATTVAGGVLITGAAAAAFAGRPGAGGFTDVGAVAVGIEHYAGRFTGVLFAVALMAGCVLGASAVSLSTAYTLGDVLGRQHSLHKRVCQACIFHMVIAALALGSAAVVLTPDTPLGLISEGVQALSGILLPSASVFLLLLCNDRAVLGPWVNTRAQNIVTASAIGLLVALSLVLSASVIFPDLSAADIGLLLATACAVGLLAVAAHAIARRHSGHQQGAPPLLSLRRREDWRTPPLPTLPPPKMSAGRHFGLLLLRGYLLAALTLVVVRITRLMLAHH